MLVIAGTRPECIKLAPVVRELGQRHGLAGIVVNSGQHVEAVRRTFAEFDIHPDLELPALPPQPNLGAASRHLVHALATVLRQVRPALVVVQGDTLTAYAGARAGARTGIPVVHVEAGLRAPSVSDPFPEEWFRRRIARYADFHFAPCASAHRNLLAEGMPADRIHDVGNTGIDSLRRLLARDASIATGGSAPRTQVLVTLHRRENWDGKANIICDALIALGEARPDLRMLVPVHPNPRIAPRIRHRLGSHPQFTLVAPMNYREFIAAAAGAALIVSDSGGIQEEVPHLGVPLLVPRSCTERPEGVASGFVRLVNVDRAAIVGAALAMLDAPRKAGASVRPRRAVRRRPGGRAHRRRAGDRTGRSRRGMTATSSRANAPSAHAAPDDPSTGSAVGRWLLEGPAQLRDGAHAGAIAGTLHDGRATYVYPEIAGYYLQWLAWRARTFGGTPALATRAHRVQDWLGAWLAADATPRTRIYLDAATDDWRNGALFFFDVAMVARGLAAAAETGLLVPDATVVRGVDAALQRLIAADGLFAACIATAPEVTLPQRWSTRRGGFLAKAAAGVIVAGRDLPGIAPEVTAAAHATFAASLDWMREQPHREAHPLLYTFEGIMALPDDARFAATLAETGRAVRCDARAGGTGRLSAGDAERGQRRRRTRADRRARAGAAHRLPAARASTAPTVRPGRVRARRGCACARGPSHGRGRLRARCCAGEHQCLGGDVRRPGVRDGCAAAGRRRMVARRPVAGVTPPSSPVVAPRR